jgi:hypothetical protein
LANIALDYVLIFGIGPFPELGMQGAALATVIAYIGAAAAYFALLSRKAETAEYAVWSHWRFERDLFSRLLRVGLPTGGQFLIDIAGFTIFLCIVGRLGPLCQKATNLAFNLNGLSFVPLMGLGTAVMSIVGRRMGEGRPELATRTVWSAFALGGGWMIVFGLVYVLVPDLILAPYAAGASPAEFADIRETAIVLLRYVAFFAFFDAMVHAFPDARDARHQLGHHAGTGGHCRVARSEHTPLQLGRVHTCHRDKRNSDVPAIPWRAMEDDEGHRIRIACEGSSGAARFEVASAGPREPAAGARCCVISAKTLGGGA